MLKHFTSRVTRPEDGDVVSNMLNRNATHTHTVTERSAVRFSSSPPDGDIFTVEPEL